MKALEGKVDTVLAAVAEMQSKVGVYVWGLGLGVRVEGSGMQSKVGV